MPTPLVARLPGAPPPLPSSGENVDVHDHVNDHVNQRFKLWLQNVVLAHVTSRLADLERQASANVDAAEEATTSPSSSSTTRKRRRRAAPEEAKSILTAHCEFQKKKGALLDALDDAFPFIRAALLSSAAAAAGAGASGAETFVAKAATAAAAAAGPGGNDDEKDEETGVAAAAAYGVGMTVAVDTASMGGKKKKKRRTTTKRPSLPTARKRRRRDTVKDANEEGSDVNESDAKIDKESDDEKDENDEKEHASSENDGGGGGDGKNKNKKATARKRKVGRPRKKKAKPPAEEKGPVDLQKLRRENDAPRWAAHLERCRKYKQDHGHLSIPPKHPEMGIYAQNMKANRRKRLAGEHLSEGALRHLDDLEELGFDFAPARKQEASVPFEDRLEQCRQYKNEHGHLYIPVGHPELGSWADEMRRKKRHWDKIQTEGEDYRVFGKRLPAKYIDQLRALDEIGFSWRKGGPGDGFDERFAELVAYKEKYGDTRVPTECRLDPSNEHAALGKWVAHVRLQYSKLSQGSKQSYLTPERMARLTEVGFMFRVFGKTTSWETRLEQLKEFKAEHGHLKIPMNHPTLGRQFAQYWRNHHKNYMEGKKTPLTAEKKKQLDDLGFVWQVGKRRPEGFQTAGSKYSWEDRLGQFKRFRARHGHPYVPQVGTPGADEPPEEVGLGRWVAKQRQRYRYMKEGKKSGGYGSALTAEQALKLTDAGFAWEASHLHRAPKNNDGATGSEVWG